MFKMKYLAVVQVFIIRQTDGQGGTWMDGWIEMSRWIDR